MSTHSIIWDSKGLVGTNGATLVLNKFNPTTNHVELSNNPGLGYLGLKALVKGMKKWERPGWELALNLNNCGLGGATTEASCTLLTEFLLDTPSLRWLDIEDNQLQNSPSALTLMDALISHPGLESLSLAGNTHLGCSSNPSTPCAISRLLCRLYTTASVSRLTLRHLDLGSTGLMPNCCGPMMKKVLSLRSKGLHTFGVDGSPALATLTHAAPLIDIIDRKNFWLKGLGINATVQVDLAHFDHYSLQVFGVLNDALDRNKLLAKAADRAACEVLKVARVVLFGYPSPSPISTEHPTPTNVLNLPSELFIVILSFIYPGALSDRQIGSILQHAANRTKLDRTTVGRSERVPHILEGQVFSDVGCWEKNDFLQHTECDGCDR